MTTIQRTRVVLKIPTKKVVELLSIAKAIANAMKANASQFPNPTPSLTVVEAQLQDLDVKQQATATRAKGTVAQRNVSRAALVTLLENLRTYVQTLCDASPEQAEALITAAGMSVAKSPVHSAAVLEAKLGLQSGSVLLRASATLLVGRGVKKHAAYNWQYSVDGGKTWTNAPATPLASTTIEGLTPLTTYSFRVSATVSKTVGAWSQAVTILVK
jgi:hypothetical protein